MSSSFGELMSSVEQKMLKPAKDVIYLDDQQLELVMGQRGKKLLLLDGYTFSVNLEVENGLTKYWCCRHRKTNQEACRARVRTQQKENGLFSVIISQPYHNHLPLPVSTFRAYYKTVERTEPRKST